MNSANSVHVGGHKTKGCFDVQGALPRIDDPRIKFVKRSFEKTIPPFIRDFSVKNRLVIHIDRDLYGGAMLVLVYLTSFMSKGTILVFDEFCDREHEFKAFRDWQTIFTKNTRIIAEIENSTQISLEVL